MDLSEFEKTEYKQSDQIKAALKGAIAQRQDVAAGICFSLCCQWIELHKKYRGMGKGEDFRIESMGLRIKNLMSDSIFFYRAMNSQASYSVGDGDKLEKKNATGSKYGLKFESETRQRTTSALAVAVNSTHLYTQTSFSLRHGRHAICAYKSGGKLFGFGSHLYVFDPNLGEYRVPDGQIKDFYSALFKHYGGVNSIFNYEVADT